MTRPTHIDIDADALRYNVARVKALCPKQQIMAMVKANAYGCGLGSVIPQLDADVDIYGVASLEEAKALRQLSRRDCVLLQGVFSSEELHQLVILGLQCVVHHRDELQWILNTPLAQSIRVWIKVNTGMQRLGFLPNEVPDVLSALRACPWVDDRIALMTHLACADEPNHPQNQAQLDSFYSILPQEPLIRSVANSGTIMTHSDQLGDVVRPGIMLYGVSPFPNQTGQQLGLKPVMRFMSAVSTINDYPAGVPIGYGGTWVTERPTRIGVVAVGYGDGYPWHVALNTPTWVGGQIAPIVGRVSMDMMTIDLTHCSHVKIGDKVELWGSNIPVETIARQAGTIAYELICQVTSRVRDAARLTSF